jgi:hypothetical protein
MKIRTLFGWLFQATKWVLTLLGGLVLVLFGLFLFDTFLPYLGQSEHGNQVQAKISEMRKTDRQDFPVVLVADFEWRHVCYAARGVMPDADTAKAVGINIDRIKQRPWFGERNFWTLIFVVSGKKAEVVRLSRLDAGGHRGYGGSQSYCLPREEAAFEVTPDKTHGHQLMLVKRQWKIEEKLNDMIRSTPANTVLRLDRLFKFDWKTLCVIPSGHQQFEVSEATGIQVEWHSVLYPWIWSTDYFSLLFLDHNGTATVARLAARHFVAPDKTKKMETTCRARESTAFLVQTDDRNGKSLSFKN